MRASPAPPLSARVTHDSVLWTVRTELRLAIPGGVTDDGISHCRGDQISAHPCVVFVEIHHFRGVKKVTVEAEWIAVLRQVLIERIIGWPIDLVTVEHTNSVWLVASVELLGDFLVDLRLAATVIAHQNHVAETVEDRFLRDALEHGSEQLVRDPDGTGKRFCIVRGVGNTGMKIALPSSLAIASTCACATRLW